MKTMDVEKLRFLLDHIGAIRDACDLDVLLFFHRHPRSLLTSEQLVDYLGYDREQVKSVDRLIEMGLLNRSQNPAHAARLYVLEHRGGPSVGSLRSLLRFASTREGRREVIRLLQPNDDRGPTGSAGGRRHGGIVKVA